jgi:hypothetical protein
MKHMVNTNIKKEQQDKVCYLGKDRHESSSGLFPRERENKPSKVRDM